MSQWGRISLWDAAADGNLDLCKRRLTNSIAQINAQDSNGRTAIAEGCRWGNLEVVKYLIENGADINLLDYSESHPLHLAAENGKNDVVEYIIKDLHVDANILDYDGNTPLIRAVCRQQKSTVELLLKLGANKSIKNSNGKDAATLSPHVSIKEILQGPTYVSPTQY
eukprot:TRINITY_DN9531_c0_g1_i2.p1 TRINITY_DN9531_c0_g1~~TRINITY_DN9531_c0_g1_i2.p1  ORF type:complete len:167 (+),score=21.89 TRINITY_DN9531_c0_g1_i2:43-543(+)